MDLVLLLLAVVVVGGVAAVALGRVRGGLEPPTSTLPLIDLPAGPLAPDDVDRVRFSLGLRGYRMDQVDAVLDRLRGELAHRDDVIAALRDRNPDGPRRGDGGGREPPGPGTHVAQPPTTQRQPTHPPTNQPPTTQHPTEKHPTEQHPTEQHPTEQHPTEQHPTMQGET